MALDRVVIARVHTGHRGMRLVAEFWARQRRDPLVFGEKCGIRLTQLRVLETIVTFKECQVLARYRKPRGEALSALALIRRPIRGGVHACIIGRIPLVCETIAFAAKGYSAPRAL